VLQKCRPALGTTQPPFLRVKQPGRDVNHSSPPSADLKNEWSHAFAPPAYLHDVDGDIFLFSVSWFIAPDVWLCVVFVWTFGSHMQFLLTPSRVWQMSSALRHGDPRDWAVHSGRRYQSLHSNANVRVCVQWVPFRSRINSTKSPASGAVKVSECRIVFRLYLFFTATLITT